ncbi:MAG: anhydro-N-acetylmuramic acid kinase, partial [Elusimicrobia bacterium]|nr:anhydro-N-acetylmuramic acid kinase [Elusimicrobiota bacterium]
MIALGIMSGTSADGVSIAAVRIQRNKLKVLSHGTYPYSKDLQNEIRGAVRDSVPELSRLNFKLGGLFADSVLKFCRQNRISLKKIFVIGSHGQTVYHGPGDRIPNTLQIGEAAIIVERTGVPVVADFRPRDIAAGGEGAPLVPFLDFFFFGRGPLRAIQNIGGIGNVTVVGGGKVHLAFDTGPGNCLMDLAVQTITKGRISFDREGQWAKKGRVDFDRVEKMLEDPYFARRPPKSLDRSYFGWNFIKKHFREISLQNLAPILATLNFFTARSIERSYRKIILPKFKIREIVVSGGGALNSVLMRNLKNLLHPIPISTSEKFGIPVLAKEPACFALMALYALR